MKNNIIALAVVVAVLAPVIAESAPRIYGKINMAVARNEHGAGKGISIDSIRSYVGIKGSDNVGLGIGLGIKAIYKLEFIVGVDSDPEVTGIVESNVLKDVEIEGGPIESRNQYLGVASKVGVIFIGRHDSPLRMSQPEDLFDGGSLDNREMTHIGFGENNEEGGEDRFKEIIAYVSPVIARTKFIIGMAPDESLGQHSSITNIYSFAFMHGSKRRGLYLALAGNVKPAVFIPSTGAGVPTISSFAEEYYRLSAQYTGGGLIANVMLQHSDSSTDGGTNIMASTGYEFGRLMPKFKISINHNNNENTGAVKKNGIIIATGVDYEVGKNTVAYLDFGFHDESFAESHPEVGEHVVEEHPTTSFKSGVVGIMHKF